MIDKAKKADIVRMANRHGTPSSHRVEPRAEPRASSKNWSVDRNWSTPNKSVSSGKHDSIPGDVGPGVGGISHSPGQVLMLQAPGGPYAYAPGPSHDAMLVSTQVTDDFEHQIPTHYQP